jgi:hypothetical protein
MYSFKELYDAWHARTSPSKTTARMTRRALRYVATAHRIEQWEKLAVIPGIDALALLDAAMSTADLVPQSRSNYRPDRCTPGTLLHDGYYTLHPLIVPELDGADHLDPYPAHNRKADVFRVPKSSSLSPDDAGVRRNRFITRHKYFVEVP